jgi:hypothetical protein
VKTFYVEGPLGKIDTKLSDVKDWRPVEAESRRKRRTGGEWKGMGGIEQRCGENGEKRREKEECWVGSF